MLFCSENGKEPRIGIALSGGGVRGLAHIGVLRRLEEEGINIDIISGSSMGALVGSLYALGYDSYEIEKIVRESDTRDILINKPERDITENYLKKTADRTVIELEFTRDGIQLPNALNNGQRVLKKLRHLVLTSGYYGSDFNNFKHRLRVVCSDVQNARKVVFDSGDLPTIILGSISFPGLFKPVLYHDMKLLDGGLTDNLPTGVLVGECDIILASDMTYDTPSKIEEYNFIELLDRISLTMTKTNIEQSVALADVVIRSELDDIRYADIENPDSLIAFGYREAGKKIGNIKELIQSFGAENRIETENLREIFFKGSAAFDHETLNGLIDPSYGIKKAGAEISGLYRKRGYVLSSVSFIEGAESDTILIEEGILKRIRVRGNRSTKGSFIRGEISINADRALKFADLERSVDNLFGTDLFHRVYYEIDHDNKEVIFTVEEKPYNLIRLGANYQTDRGFLGLIELSNKNLHGKRAEIYGGLTYGEKFNRLELSYYNPFLRRSTLFFEILPYFQIRDREFYTTDHKKIPEQTFSERRAGINLNTGFQFFDNYQGVFSLVQEKIDYKDDYFDRTSAVFSVLADSRNDHIIPEKGVYFSWSMETGLIDFDTEKAFQKVWWEFSVYKNIFKRLNIELGLCGGTGDNLVPQFERYLRGGIRTMPGSFQGQFSKTQYFTLITKHNLLLKSTTFYDSYLTYGYYLNGLWDSPEIELTYRDFVNSFYAGFTINTTLGPLETGWGFTAGNGSLKFNNRFFLSIGYPLI